LLPVDEQAQFLEQQITRLQAGQSRLLIDAERSGTLADSGCQTARSFAASILRRSATDASAFAAVARHLVSFPKLAAAYADGSAHNGNMRAVMAQIPRCGLAALQAHEDALVVLATGAGPREIYLFGEQLADLDNPDRDGDKVVAAGMRSVKIARVGDLAHLDAMIDPVVADQLKASLAALAKASRVAKDERSYAERRADAFESILRRGMDGTDLPEQARRRPHATVTVQLETLRGMPGSGRALLERFGLIPRATAARVACDALVRLVIQDGERVLNVGHTQRVVTDRQHAALATLYDSCIFPGCGVKFSDCEIHHLWWHSLGGPTDLDLQVPKCPAHHRLLHEFGYTVTVEDSRLVHRDPKARIIADPRQVLTGQLRLLDSDTPGEVDEIADHRAEDSHGYRTGVWGWTGQDPNPPPGHDPPPPPERPNHPASDPMTDAWSSRPSRCSAISRKAGSAPAGQAPRR